MKSGATNAAISLPKPEQRFFDIHPLNSHSLEDNHRSIRLNVTIDLTSQVGARWIIIVHGNSVAIRVIYQSLRDGGAIRWGLLLRPPSQPQPISWKLVFITITIFFVFRVIGYVYLATPVTHFDRCHKPVNLPCLVRRFRG